MTSKNPKNTINKIKEQLFQLVGMTSLAERVHLYEYANNEYSGEGEIVDLGCWLGSSSIALAMGLENNDRVENKKNRIHAHDLFEWRLGMENHPHLKGTYMEDKYKEGDCFIDECIKRIEPWKTLIDVNQSDLTKKHWSHDSKIDYLFIDAMKSWPLANNILKGFFPALVAERSFIHHNDWVNTLQYEIHLLMYRMREYFEPIKQANNAMIFKLKQAIDNDILNESYSLDSFSTTEIDSAFGYALSISSIPDTHACIAAAKVQCLIDLGDLEKARLELNLAQLKKDEISDSRFNYDRWFSRLERLLNQQ